MQLESKIQILSKILDENINVFRLENSNSILPKHVFFSFYIGKNNIKEDIMEQLEIVFQILINQGYTILVANIDDKDLEVCQNFIEIFKNQNIKYVGNIREDTDVISVLEQTELAIVMDKESLKYSLLLEKPFISLFTAENLLEKLVLQNLFISDEAFHAGVLLEKIKQIKENSLEIKKAILKIFGEHKEVSTSSNIRSINNETNILTDEMEKYQKRFKENIQSLIEQGLLKEAENMINEYEKIVKDDIDIYSIKGVIAMMEGDIDGAFATINTGLLINPNHVDLLYNKAYLFEQIKEYKESYRLYKNIINYTNEHSLKEEVEEKLKEIKKMDNSVDLNGRLSLLAIDKRVSCDVCNFIVNWFHEFGFTILRSLDTDKLVINKNYIKKCIIMYDLNPKEMQLENKIKYPDIDNERYFLIEALQKQLLIEFGIKGIDDYLYLTKNESEAKNITQKLLQGEIQDLYINIQNVEESYKTKYPVVKLFDGFRHRAKTELIHYRDGLAVKKTWKPGNEKFIEREKFAYGTLSKSIPYIPPLLESGKNYIIIPYYEDILKKDEIIKKRVLTTHIVDIATFFKQLYEAGYFNPDIHPGQFIFSEKEGLKAIDFEYLQSYERKPDLFTNSYDIQGYPKNFKGDKPNYIGKNLHKLYDNLWVKYTGYTLEQIANLVMEGKYGSEDLEINKVLGLLNYAKTSGKSYDGSLYGSAYHSLKLKGYYFRGQRECSLRLQNVPYDFSDKVVLDIGCNAGGMLHSLSSKIKMGVGIDYDYRLINAANAIKTINKSNNLSFYRFDLENEDLNLINNYILSEDGKVDICFLLSVCMWIKNWKEVIKFVSTISENLLFETNGSHQQQKEQIEELQKVYSDIEIVEEESNDDPGQPNRKLIFCNKSDKLKIKVNNNINGMEKLLNKIIKKDNNIVFNMNNLSKKKMRY